MDRKKLAALCAALAAIFTLLGTLIAPSDTTVKTTTVPVSVAAPAGDLQTAAPTPGQPATEAPADSDLRDETPPDVPAATLAKGKAATDQAADAAGVTDQAQPVGGAQNYSVRQDFSGHVYSDFGSVTPTEFCLHYTVSSNVTGWGDVLAIRDYFKRTMAASATYIADFEGHVLQMVPLSHKAWTQGAFNPFCRASIEMIATGRETRAQWLASKLIHGRVLASLMHDVMGKYRIPLRWVDPVGCAAPAGYTDHNHIECGNDHVDVGHQFPFTELARQLREGPNGPCGQTCRNLRRRHRHVHAELRRVCAHPAGRARHPKVCRKLANRNSYMHRYAHGHGFKLT